MGGYFDGLRLAIMLIFSWSIIEEKSRISLEPCPKCGVVWSNYSYYPCVMKGKLKFLGFVDTGVAFQATVCRSCRHRYDEMFFLVPEKGK